MDNTTKFQGKFDLYELLRENGVDAKDTKYILDAVNEYERLKQQNGDLNHNIGVYGERLNRQYSNYKNEITRLKQENKTEFDQYQIRLAVRDGEIDESKQLNHVFALEIKRLQNLHDAAMVLQGRIITKNEKLKEVLKECNPLNVLAYADIEAECQFCKGKITETQKFGQWELNLKHSEDCEYMRLCGEGGADGET